MTSPKGASINTSKMHKTDAADDEDEFEVVVRAEGGESEEGAEVQNQDDEAETQEPVADDADQFDLTTAVDAAEASRRLAAASPMWCMHQRCYEAFI